RGDFPGDPKGFDAAHSLAFRTDNLLSRTTDGGAHWSVRQTLFSPRANEFSIGNIIAVEPDGTLVDIFQLEKGDSSQPQAGHYYEAVITSSDHGVTWSQPNLFQTSSFNGIAGVRTAPGLPEIAVDPTNGNLYAVWEDSRFSGFAHDDIAFSISTDEGVTWS